MGLCKNHPHTPALWCSTPGPARPPGELCQKALVPTQVWPPREATAWQGEGGEHLLKFRVCHQPMPNWNPGWRGAEEAGGGVCAVYTAPAAL